MRYPASEKLEIIRLVGGSHLPVKRTLDQLGVSRPTFYRWYGQYRRFGESGLEDRKSHPGRVWNRIPDHVREAMLQMALIRPELSPRELAVTFTDERRYFVSEASVYRLLRSQDLITSPAFIVMKAANEFKDNDWMGTNHDCPQSALADRLHLSQSDRLGLVLSLDNTGRLLPIHYRLEALHRESNGALAGRILRNALAAPVSRAWAGRWQKQVVA